MELVVKPYECLCELETFTINGIPADYDDFGHKYDTDIMNAPDYGCGNMKFVPQEPTAKVLHKYQITPSEYSRVCDELMVTLSFGYCGWCI